MACGTLSRKVLNRFYNSLDIGRKVRFHARFARLFRGRRSGFTDGKWRLRFGGKTIWVPLRREFAWLDWETSLSLVAHEPEIKQTYLTLMQLERPPRLVLDIGANYGTHTVIFLVHGIPTVSFEPNPACHDFIRLLCGANGVSFRLEPMALGQGEGQVDLWYPEGETWLGTTDPDVKMQIAGQLTRTAVRQSTVDSYVTTHGLAPDLLKIDTEGADFAVMQGSVATLKSFRPLVLFESWPSGDRKGLSDFLEELDYRICRLPLLVNAAPRQLSREELQIEPGANFAALPAAMLRSWPRAFPSPA